MPPPSEVRPSIDTESPSRRYGSRQEYPFLRQGSLSALSRRSSNASSVGGMLDTGSIDSALVEPAQNAISTLLQAPIVRTGLLPHASLPSSSAFKPPTAKDIPPVTLSNVKHVDLSEFRTYMAQVGPLYDQLERALDTEDGGLEMLRRKGSRVDAAEEGRLRPIRRLSRQTSVSSISSLTPDESPTAVRRTSSGFTRRANQGPPPLSTIPVVYFDEDFHLENPRTFDIVSERSEIVRPPPGSAGENGHATAPAPRKALATNAILQEKLSWYMDTVEMHLISSIATASTTFFSALGSLKELHTEAAQSVGGISAIREELGNLEREVATSGLDLVEKRRRRENLEQLQDTIVQLRDVLSRASDCEALVEDGRSDEALDHIEALEALMAGEEPSNGARSHAGRQPALRDLRGATALHALPDSLSALRTRIGKGCESRFVNCLLEDLRGHVREVSDKEVLLRWNNASSRMRSHGRQQSAFPSYLSSSDSLRHDLAESLGTLFRAKGIASATAAYREAALKELRSLIRRPLPSSNDDDNESMMSSSTMTGGRKRTQQERSSALAKNLRALDPEDAEEMLTKIYIGVTETLRRVTTQVKLLLDVASSIQSSSDEPKGGPTSPLRSAPPKATPLNSDGRRPSLAVMEAQEEIHKTLDMSVFLGQATDSAQEQIVKLLRVRAEQSTHLPLIQFLRYFTLNLHFANECESISGRGGSTLKNVVNGHIKDFVHQHGDSEKQKLAQRMDSDQWNAIDFTDRDTAHLDEILGSTDKDPEAWLMGTQLWLPSTEPVNEDESAAPVDGTAKAKTRNAVIDEVSFVLPDSAVACMEGISKFLHLIVGIPPMTTDVAASLISYIQLFNSRCTQLILGAGATRSAGLKNITTKHLALASQALAYIAALISHVREFVRRRAGSGATVSTLMGEFDKIKRTLQEHQNSIYDKLVEIMSGRASSHAKVMQTIDWDKPDQTGPHTYMETLAKETTTLHRNLVKHLPESSIRAIMAPVFASYKTQLGKVFGDGDPKTEIGRDSMLRDVELFEAKLSKIDCFDDAAEHLETIIKGKEIKVAEPPPPSPPPTSATAEQTPAEEEFKSKTTSDDIGPTIAEATPAAKEPQDSIEETDKPVTDAIADSTEDSQPPAASTSDA